MITCPWCGTHYDAFQSNCRNCGGPLPLPVERPSPAASGEEPLPVPPPPPRAISDSYTWKLFWADGWAVAAGIFALVGAIFAFVGFILTIGIVTAFVGIPFAGLGMALLATALLVAVWRYRETQRIVWVLRDGVAARGRILSLQRNYSVQVNDRHPWTIAYQFQVEGRGYQGRLSTFNDPRQQFQPDGEACILYLPNMPEYNTVYPHP
jgi:hypothetical protein